MNSPSFLVPELKLVARRIGMQDAEDWFQFAVLPEVRQFTSLVVEVIDDIHAAIGRTLTGDPSAPMYFSVRHQASDKMVALVGFHTRSLPNRSAEINYELAPSVWGRGVATAICRAATDWIMSEHRLVRVQATTLEENVASQRVLLKAGFVQEGKLRNFRILGGRPRDYLVFSRIATPSHAA